MTPCDHPIEQPYEHPYPEEVDLCPKCGNWMPLLVVTASRTDKRPHPDVMASSAHAVSPDAGRVADAPGPSSPSTYRPDGT